MQSPPTLHSNAGGTGTRLEPRLRWAFGAALLLRLLFPFYNSPLGHLFSDPGRHWENGQRLFNPTIIGAGDPILYQVWIHLLQRLSGNQAAAILTGCGLLCAAMPYGWYRTFKELLPKPWALGGALLMALLPDTLGIYAYFMNETLLLSLTGFAFWATLRAQRKRTFGAFALACALWLAAGFTRVVAMPLALACLLLIWLPQPQKPAKAAAGLAMLLALAVPAGLHARLQLHYFAPFGNLYLNEIYRDSGNRNIAIDFGPQGQYQFGSPSFYNPTFQPFSNWAGTRAGTVSIRIDTSQGRAAWIAEQARVRALRSFSRLRDFWENFLFLTFGPSWPDDDGRSLSGWLAIWSRWMWPPLIAVVAWGAARRRYRGREWLLPACALGMFLYLALQQEGIMEPRFRKPIDPIIMAAAVVLAHRLRSERRAAPAIAA